MRSLKGKALQYKPLRFTTREGTEWVRVNNKQTMGSILAAVKVKDENYQCLLVCMVSAKQEQAKSMLQVWASWFPEPRDGDIIVCLYHEPALEDNG